MGRNGDGNVGMGMKKVEWGLTGMGKEEWSGNGGTGMRESEMGRNGDGKVGMALGKEEWG